MLQSSSKKLHLKEHSVVGGDGTEHSLVTRFVCLFSLVKVCVLLLPFFLARFNVVTLHEKYTSLLMRIIILIIKSRNNKHLVLINCSFLSFGVKCILYSCVLCF